MSSGQYVTWYQSPVSFPERSAQIDARRVMPAQAAAPATEIAMLRTQIT